MADTKSRLLDAAAPLVQTRGYNGFSFHDLAETVGVRTASIHYHFPTKADLCQALVARYTRDFMAALGDPNEGTPDDRLKQYVGLFRAALMEGRMCLCGMIGAEVGGVPDDVGQSIRSFFSANEDWLASIYTRIGWATNAAADRARLMLAALEGALMLARAKQDIATFDGVASLILSLGEPKR
jgi:TetR/AcrR family transcriptional regulator, transcriptional repressor for nem operon